MLNFLTIKLFISVFVIPLLTTRNKDVSFFDYILCCKGEPKMYCEQDAINKYLSEFPHDNNIKFLTHPSINSYLYENYPEIPAQEEEYGQWVPGNFVLHLPGMSQEKRIEIMKNTPVIL